MQENSLILSECQEINTLLHKPISTTQRIKYTCLNVSTNYIALGSTSGSLYLFTRETCTFQQLIPLSEGAVTQILISPDERVIALATNRGSVCLVILKPGVRQSAVSIEHIGENVTSLCWDNTSRELYIGDGSGKISIMILSIFTVNGMFPTPVSVLMRLDSSIVQMDFCSPLLLISTLTRCYICDTVKEEYKQIGNKMRDGEFGACFYKRVDENEKDLCSIQQDQTISNRTGSFNLIAEGETNITEENHLRIYCARPGSRLWEVLANGTVVKTHQLKEAFAIPPSCVYNPQVPKSAQIKQTDDVWPPQSFSFSRLLVIGRNYLFTHTANGIYVIDPVNATVTLWTNEYTNIVTANVLQDKIYLMTNAGVFHCLSFTSPDSLVLQLYDNKRYNECLRACTALSTQLFKSVPTRELTEVCDIESKLDVLENSEISIHLLPLITLIRSNLNTVPLKLDSGIVVVNPGKLKSKGEATTRKWTAKGDRSQPKDMNPKEEDMMINAQTDRPLDSLSDADSTIEYTCSDIVEEPDIIKNGRKYSWQTVENNKTRESSDAWNESETNSTQNGLNCVQTELKTISLLADTITSSMPDEELEAVILKIQERLNDVKNTCQQLEELNLTSSEALVTTEQYYRNILLSNLAASRLSAMESKRVFDEALTSFIEINSINYKECKCGFPFPNEKLARPKFQEIGTAVLRRLLNEDRENCINFCQRVPYMWRNYLPWHVEQGCAIDDIILLNCLQTRDAVVISILLTLETQRWESAVDCFNKIGKGVCVSCSTPIENESSAEAQLVNWNAVGDQVMRKHGPDFAMKFLSKAHSVFPDVSFNKSMFQSIIFAKILKHRGLKNSVNFNLEHLGGNDARELCCIKVQDKLLQSFERDLRKPVTMNVFAVGAHHWGIQHKSKPSICPCCTLSLQTPVLLGNNGITLFPCGHAYHVNCLIQKKMLRCNLNPKCSM